MINLTGKIQYLVFHDDKDIYHYVIQHPLAHTITAQPFVEQHEKLEELKKKFSPSLQNNIWPPESDIILSIVAST